MRGFLALLVALPAWGFAATVEEDVQRYIAVFQGADAEQHNRAVEDLAWMGLSDPRLFDLLERKILDEAQAARAIRAEKDRVARYIRALGFSGQAKYVPTLTRLQDDRVYQRYAVQALQERPHYERWNPVISSRATFDPARSDDANRVMNMLRADDLLLVRIGAKRAYFAPDDAILDEVARVLETRFRQPAEGPEQLDAVAWLAKALSKTSRYDGLLEQAMGEAPDRKVRNAAASALRHRR